MTRYKEFDDADDFLAMADCAAVSDEAEHLLVEIEEHGLMETFGRWMFKRAGDYCDVDGYDFEEMIRAFCRLKEIINV